ncbi:hypothetical protein TL16_g03760 [Triparma laevis f. inornata]|uniref:EF-hand domain-containing protein n=1 Tax=Triparma laevis f. inornata TaxID=1714386 RepID=A0A9W7E2N1_9STRA|nr:hypothetical protein TL16_g03760 [Triparma laevis f. inornata]
MLYSCLLPLTTFSLLLIQSTAFYLPPRIPFVRLKVLSSTPTSTVISDSFINDGMGDQSIGKVQVVTSSPTQQVSTHHPLKIYYTPPPTFTPTTLTLGYNNWTPDSEGQDLLLLQSFKDSDLALGSYYVNLIIPNFALTLKLAFHNDLDFDLGPSGEGYKIHVTDVQVERDGKIYEATHDCLTGKVELISEIETVDPLELEKKLREKFEAGTPQSDVDVNMEEMPNTILVAEGSEDVIRGFLAEADVVGKILNMGNMEIGEARQAFDFLDVLKNGKNVVEFEELGKLCVSVGFEIEKEGETAHISGLRVTYNASSF